MGHQMGLLQVPVSQLRPGDVLSCPVYDEQERKLLGSGIAVTESWAEKLRRRGIKYVSIDGGGWAGCKTNQVDQDEDFVALLCQKCKSLLPLCLSGNDEPSVDWACACCKNRYRGHIKPGSSPEIIKNVQPTRFNIDRARLTPPSSDVAEFASRLVPGTYTGKERRATVRCPFVLAIPALPLDEAFKPAGEPFMIMSRNISSGGIGLVSRAPVRVKNLLLDLSARDGKHMQIIAELTRCRSVDGFYDIGGKFVMRTAD